MARERASGDSSGPKVNPSEQRETKADIDLGNLGTLVHADGVHNLLEVQAAVGQLARPQLPQDDAKAARTGGMCWI